MCTLIIATCHFPDTPLVVASNRDELLARPAGPPELRAGTDPAVLAPLDLQAGGSWLGLNAAGLFVGITNRFGRNPDRRRRSRGELVMAALEEPTARAAAERMARVDPCDYNGFHLVMADRREAHVVRGDGRELARQTLEPGVHGITERSFGAAPSAREELIRRRAPAAGGLDELAELLCLHGEPSFDGLCVHTTLQAGLGDLAGAGYGTRSSTLLELRADGRVRLEFADGPPCTTPFRDYSRQAAELLA